MFNPSLRLWQATALTANSLKTHLPQKWFGDAVKPHVGLAVSGGVDSMALATLCSQLRKESDGKAVTFTAFIVDHGLRPGSRDEARTVAKLLEQLDMPSKILTLDQQEYGDAHVSKTVESIARRLRYRALGDACRTQGIVSLLFAHHADDQAETTLMRLANGYLGKGLGGMQWEARIPECEDMYGVHDSGFARVLRHAIRLYTPGAPLSKMLIESGGITVIRPLLQFAKDRLVATCERAGVRWVEDETNKDPSLTLRNTIRQMHENDFLPVALRRPNLCAIATRTSDLADQREAKADEIFQRCSVRIDTRSGRTVCGIPKETVVEIAGLSDGDHIKALLLRKLLQLVVPGDNMDLSSVERAGSDFLALGPEESKKKFKLAPITLAGATAVPLDDPKGGEGEIKYELRPVPPPKNANHKPSVVTFELPTSSQKRRAESVVWSDWRLWDGRYWIRVGGQPGKHTQTENIIVRTLMPEDVADLRRESNLSTLEKAFTGIKGNLRFTLPVLVWTSSGADGSAKHRIVALPSLGWDRDGWTQNDNKIHENAKYLYDIRYRKIDDSLTKPLETTGASV